MWDCPTTTRNLTNTWMIIFSWTGIEKYRYETGTREGLIEKSFTSKLQCVYSSNRLWWIVRLYENVSHATSRPIYLRKVGFELSYRRRIGEVTEFFYSFRRHQWAEVTKQVVGELDDDTHAVDDEKVWYLIQTMELNCYRTNTRQYKREKTYHMVVEDTV